MGALTSNTIVPWLRMTVPFVSPDLGITVNCTEPCPAGGAEFGGKNPTRGSTGTCRVSGSIEVRRQVISPPESRAASILTIMF